MKETVVETCGKIWHELGFRGEASTYDLARTIGEDEEIVNLALGWLTREDKVNCSKKRNGIMFSLVDSETKIFREFYKDGRPRRKLRFWHKLFR